MTGKSNLAQKVPVDIALVVFGRDPSKRCHASRFGMDAMKSAQDAAKAMGMRSLRVETDDMREIARKLPKGTTSPKGRVVIPMVRPALYNKLLAIAGTEATPPPPPGPQPADPGKKPTTADAKSDGFGGWTGLQKDTVVLATERVSEGWWEATVVHVNDTILTLRWRDHPSLPQFQRTLTQVALLHPKMVKPC